MARLARLHGRLGWARDDTDEEIRLCRIECIGDDDWGFALDDPATETYEPAVLLGGQPFGGAVEAFDAAVTAMLDDARGWRLAEMRKRRGMTQEQVAVRMGVSAARVSQIESGDVSTQDVLSRDALRTQKGPRPKARPSGWLGPT
ncbi:MAG TPA: helix-turn-helix transcriptional regulator [Frankiaceae bacterium]|nr:helix-turn-helix transcriptional regulator [Frankiaceae bacterium]